MTRARPTRLSRVARTLSTALLAALLALPSVLKAQSLRGSPTSMDRQNAVARAEDFTFIRTGAQLRTFVKSGWLVRVRPDRNFTLHGVSYPYARPATALFITRLAAQYRAACGEQLVVTSLTRPMNHQPRNASSRSVHPTGMAADIRYTANRKCRRWIEGVLMSLEKARVLEATREHYPAHYHVAVFPDRYEAYVKRLQTRRATSATRVAQVSYKVRSGDSLWTIARKHGTTVARLKQINEIDGSRILPGQLLEVPASSR